MLHFGGEYKAIAGRELRIVCTFEVVHLCQQMCEV